MEKCGKAFKDMQALEVAIVLSVLTCWLLAADSRITPFIVGCRGVGFVLMAWAFYRLGPTIRASWASRKTGEDPLNFKRVIAWRAVFLVVGAFLCLVRIGSDTL